MPGDEGARERSITHLERARASVERVIVQSRATADRYPDRRELAEARIAQAEQELLTLETEIGALQAGLTLDDATTPAERAALGARTLTDARDTLDRMRRGR